MLAAGGLLAGLSLLAAPAAHAGVCDPGSSSGSAAITSPPTVDGATLYADADPLTGGAYAGLLGNTGYVEASGNPVTQQAGVYGSSTDGTLSGQAQVSSSGPGVCINGTTVP